MNPGTHITDQRSGRLSRKTALITGAASGIGLATAKLFASEGASLVLIDLQREALEEASRELNASGTKAVAIAADVRDSDAIRDAVATAVREFGRLDILFANAGVGSTVTITEASDDDWDRVMGINGKGVFICCRGAIKQMLMQTPAGGSIVICGSIS